jgi:hypothetical protein
MGRKTTLGWIEIGQDDYRRSMVRALDEGGIVWEGKTKYATLDELLRDLETGLANWMKENVCPRSTQNTQRQSHAPRHPCGVPESRPWRSFVAGKFAGGGRNPESNVNPDLTGFGHLSGLKHGGNLMTNEPTNQPTVQPTEQPTSQQKTADAWREVGKQFEALGNSLASAFRTAWEDENTRRHVHEMQTGLETMVNEVSRAIKETAESPEGQKARIEAERAAQSLRAAGEKTWQESKPQLVSALRQLSAELQKTITRLEEEAKPTETEGTEGDLPPLSF